MSRTTQPTSRSTHGRKQARLPRAILVAALTLSCLVVASAPAGAAGAQARISQVGPDGNPAYDGLAPAVAYNARADQYLTVWEADDSTDEESEIHGRVVNASGAPVSAEFRISQTGPDGDPNFDAFRPTVAYSFHTNEYLVAWYGNAAGGDEFEIYGQRVSAGGAEIGANDFRISDMGPEGNPSFDASRPALAYNQNANEFVVVWYGDDTVSNEFEIYGQRVSGSGSEIGANDFRISDAGPNGDAGFDVFKPAIAHNPQANEYLVTWYGDDTVADELEIYGQRLNGAGAEVGTNDFRISDMGPNGSTSFEAQRPSVAYNPHAGEYLVAWDGDDDTAPLVDNESEVHGQRLSATGAEVGANDFRISRAGPHGNNSFDAFRPVVAHAPGGDYLVVWYADGAVNGELEVYGQNLSAAGAAVGAINFRLSRMGPDFDASFDAADPSLASGARANEYLAVWSGDDSSTPLADDEFEIFGSAAPVASPPPGAVTQKPHLKLTYRKRQRITKRGFVIVYAKSDQAGKLLAKALVGRARAKSSKSRKLRSLRRTVSPNRRYKLRFKLSRKVRREVRRKLRRNKRSAVRVTVRMNADGGTATARAFIRAKR